MDAMIRPVLARLTRRPGRVLLGLLLLLIITLSLARTGPAHRPPQPQQYYQKKTKSFFPPLRNPGSNPNLCDGFPISKLDEIQVVLKTSAGERNKTRAHLRSVTSCLADKLLVVSDHADEIEGHDVVDILAELPDSYRENNSDYQIYLKHKDGRPADKNADFSQGWKLDRFKYLPMVDKAFELNPRAKWFVFLDTDTYIVWDTLFRLLDQMSPDEKHYMGAPVPPSKASDRNFAYGGAGFVLSQALVRELLPARSSGGFERLAHRLQEQVKNDCCGDAVLAHAILNLTDTRLEAMYPTFSGDSLRTLRVTKRRWCVPLLTLHRLSADEMEKLWHFERAERPYNTKPFVYSNLLAYTHPFLKDGASREWWDNLSEAPVPNDRPAHRDAGSCGSECEKDQNCLQWSYSQTVCRFADYIKVGNAVDRENDGQGNFISGWNLKKMAELGFRPTPESDIFDTCEEATWLTPQPPPMR